MPPLYVSPHLLVPPALVAPAAAPVEAPYVLRGAPISPAALAELTAETRRGWREWDPRPWWARPVWPDPPPIMELDSNQKVFLSQGDDFSDLRGTPGLNFIVIGTVSGKVVKVTGPGTLGQPIVLRGASDDDSNNGAAYTELATCTGALFAGTSTRCIFYRFRLKACTFSPTGGSLLRLARLVVYGNVQTSDGGVGNPFDTMTNVKGLRLDRSWFGSPAGVPAMSTGMISAGGTGFQDIEVTRVHCVGFKAPAWGTGSNIIGLVYPNAGIGARDYGTGFSLWLHHSMVQSTDSLPNPSGGKNDCNLMESKSYSPIISDNTIRYDLSGQPGINIRLRDGQYGQILRNLYWYQGAGRGGGKIQLRGIDEQCIGNASLSLDGSVNAGTSVLGWDGNIDSDFFAQQFVPGAGDNLGNCKRGSFAANAMNVVLANTGSATSANHPNHYNATDCKAPAAGRSDSNASITDNGTNTDRAARFAALLSDARSLRPLTATDVGVALPN